MTNREIYTRALALVNEALSGGNTSDYEERAPYLLASICTECFPLDRAFRAAYGKEAGTEITTASVALTGEFPLSGEFAPAVAAYLASLLVLDENEQMSDKLFHRYADAVSTLRNSIPASSTPIRDCYGVI